MSPVPADRHEWFVEVGEFNATLSVVCPYEPTDETRPCWPHDQTGPEGEWLPMQPPQTLCTYQDWVDACTMDEMTHGTRDLPLGPVEVSWENGQLEVHL